MKLSLRTRTILDKIVGELETAKVRKLFDIMDRTAAEHDEVERQVYLALYRRLHG
jgi:hypothetical protein